MKLAYADIGNTVSLKLSKKNLEPLGLMLRKNKNVVCLFENTQSIELLSFLLNFTGPCEITLTSYSLSDRAVNFLYKQKLLGNITNLKVLVDWRIRQSNASLVQHLRNVCDQFAFDNFHAKIWLFENDAYKICFVSSVNVGHNPRKEAGSIFLNDRIFDTFKSSLHESFKS